MQTVAVYPLTEVNNANANHVYVSSRFHHINFHYWLVVTEHNIVLEVFSQCCLESLWFSILLMLEDFTLFVYKMCVKSAVWIP